MNITGKVKKEIQVLFDYFVQNVTNVLSNKRDETIQTQFNNFKHHLHTDVRSDLGDAEIIDLIAQNFITRPIIDIVFEESEAYKKHPTSLCLETLSNTLKRYGIGSVSRLKPFYDKVRESLAGCNNYIEKQVLLNSVFEELFKQCLNDITRKYGIAYTPPEVVDFIIQSCEDLCQKHFGKSLGDQGVKITDPFTGTGTFMTHLLNSDHITPEQVEKKNERGELQCNEITLIAWYIASLNLDYVLDSKVQPKTYAPFEGINCVDTFTT